MQNLGVPERQEEKYCEKVKNRVPNSIWETQEKLKKNNYWAET